VPSGRVYVPNAATAETSHAERSWSKAVASQNTLDMLATADVSHAERSWSKAVAPQNTPHMVAMPVAIRPACSSRGAS